MMRSSSVRDHSVLIDDRARWFDGPEVPCRSIRVGWLGPNRRGRPPSPSGYVTSFPDGKRFIRVTDSPSGNVDVVANRSVEPAKRASLPAPYGQGTEA